MKLNTSKKVLSQDKEKLVEIADQLGDRYVSDKGKIDETANRLGVTIETIKSFGEKFGKKDRSTLVVTGRRWKVGVIKPIRHSFDEKKILRVLGKAVLERISKLEKRVVVERVFDKDKIRAMIAEGKLSSAKLRSCLVTEELTPKVYVKSANSKDKHEASENFWE